MNVATVVLAVAAMLLLMLAVCRSMAALVRGTVKDRGEDDPMFAEQALSVTRPPELTENVEAWGFRARDASKEWVYQTLTPIGDEQSTD